MIDKPDLIPPNIETLQKLVGDLSGENESLKAKNMGLTSVVNELSAIVKQQQKELGLGD